MSGVVKGIKKAVKGIVKGIKKVFKAITKSTLGKVLLFAAFVYLGGAAFGAWESPFASVNGALTSAGSQASQAAAAAEGAAVSAEAATVVEGAGLAEGAAAAGEAGLADVAGAAATDTLPSLVETTAQGLIPDTATLLEGYTASVPSTLGKVVEGAKTVGTFAKDNKLLTAMGFNAVSQGVQAREEEKERKRMQENLAVGDINLGMSPGARRAADTRLSSPGAARTGTQGVINTKMRG